MTSPVPPHQDPATHQDLSKVTMLEYVTTLVSTLDRRFDTLHQDLKDHIAQRFIDSDLRYQERFDQQQKALEAALAAQEKAISAALAAADRATSKAETAADKRFESVNEFRKTLTDQTASFMPRAEVESRLASMVEKVDDLKTSRDSTIGRMQAVPNADTQIQRLTDEVRALRDYRESTQGQKAGANQLWLYTVGAIGLVVVLVNVFIAVLTN